MYMYIDHPSLWSWHSEGIMVFQPSIEVLNELGDQLTSYANGYISLDEEVSTESKCVRTIN
jgi:hypothetical protein